MQDCQASLYAVSRLYPICKEHLDTNYLKRLYELTLVNRKQLAL
jgi:hypothetical protein